MNLTTLIFLLSFFYPFQPHNLSDRPLIDMDPDPEEITLTTKDGIQVFGDFYFTEADNPTILLFHQGGSNSRAEYAPIIPKFLEKGYNLLAIDQRQGGQTFGGYNRTVAKLETSYTYCEAYQDLEGALSFIQSKKVTGPIVVWGSSYSGSLAIQLANKNQNSVSAVLAFSPASGGPMQDCKPDPYLKDLNTPLLVLRPASELQIESAKAQFELVEELNHQTYVAENGTHGSSMLVAERVEGSVEENWTAVFSFIEKAIK